MLWCCVRCVVVGVNCVWILFVNYYAMLYGLFFVLLCLCVLSLHVIMRFVFDLLCNAVCSVCHSVLLFCLCSNL